MQTSSSDPKHAGFIIRPQTWIFEICTGSHVLNTAWKVSKYGVFSGPYFPAFGLNTERYGLSLRIQSECGKIRTRKNSVVGHFSRVKGSGFLKKVLRCFIWFIFSQRTTARCYSEICGWLPLKILVKECDC